MNNKLNLLECRNIPKKVMSSFTLSLFLLFSGCGGGGGGGDEGSAVSIEPPSQPSPPTDIELSDSQIDLSKYKSLIPFYRWDTLISELDNLPTMSSIIINSPTPGGYFMNSIFLDNYGRKFSKDDIDNVNMDELNEFEKILYYCWKNNNKVVAYIATNSGYLTFDGDVSDPDRDWILPDGTKLVNIKSKIDIVLEQYNVDGFFFDETDWGANPDLYKQIYNYIKGISKDFIVVLNSGYTTEEETMNYSDIAVMVENYPESIEQWEENYRPYLNNYPEYKSAILGHTCNIEDIRTITDHYNNVDLDGNESTRFMIYLTQDGEDGNPWDSLDFTIFNYY